MAVLACDFLPQPRHPAVAEPLGYAERQQESAKRNAHQSDDQREPTGIGAGSGRGKAAQHRNQQNGG
jgi:hypothetical protein